MGSGQTREVAWSLLWLRWPEGELDSIVECVETCVNGSAAADDPVAMQTVDLECGMRHCLARGLAVSFLLFEILAVTD